MWIILWLLLRGVCGSLVGVTVVYGVGIGNFDDGCCIGVYVCAGVCSACDGCVIAASGSDIFCSISFSSFCSDLADSGNSVSLVVLRCFLFLWYEPPVDVCTTYDLGATCDATVAGFQVLSLASILTFSPSYNGVDGYLPACWS